MAFRQNRRNRVLTTVNPFVNAEGVIPLTFRNMKVHDVLATDQVNSRNGLQQIKVTLIDLENGKTVGVLAQLGIAEKLLAAKQADVPVKFIGGARCRAEFQTGMTQIFAEKIEVELPEPKTETPAGPVPVEVIAAAGRQAAKDLNVTVQ